MTTTGSAPHLITSLQNDRIKAIRALEMRKVRRETGLFVAEGTSLLMSARQQGWQPETLVFLKGLRESRDDARHVARELVHEALEAGCDCLEVSEVVLAKIAAKDNPQSLIGVFRQRCGYLPPPQSVPEGDVWLALEEIRDPGNLGTIMRTAEAVGVAGLVLVGSCCDPFSREAVRASMGSVFAVPVCMAEASAFADWMSRWPGDTLGLHLKGAEDFRCVDARGPCLVVMGSEGPGLSDEVTALCSRRVKIPMRGRLDSLNLAVATALVLYEVRRRDLQL